MDLPDSTGDFEVSVADGIADVIPALVMDEETTILSITPRMAELWSRPASEMLNEQLVSILFESNRWAGIAWVTPIQQIALIKTYMEDARQHGRTGAEVLFYTPNQMLYRGSVNVQWRRSSGTYLLWFNFNDTLTQRDPHGVNQVWAADESIYQTDGPELKQSEIDLLEHYCRSKSLAELAESYGTTYKSMEHRLRQLAEAHGFNSMTEFMKSLVSRILKRFARPHNTVRLYNNLNSLDASRRRELPYHKLPPSLRSEALPEYSADDDIEEWVREIKSKRNKPTR